MPADIEREHAWAVVLAGGDGKRLQELTHRVAGDSRPKQFCSFFGGKSLLTHTRERIAPMFPRERTLFVVTRAHETYYREELPDAYRRTVVQPCNRGTAVAMAVCLQAIVRQDQDALVAFFPSDHHYSDSEAFRSSVESGLGMVKEYPNSVLILGAEARYPEVEYGWIQPGRTLVDSPAHPLQQVARFWEKPPLPRARLLQRRGCLWNTFVMIGLASAFLELLQTCVPPLLKSLDGWYPGGHLERIYGDVGSIDFSREVLARVPNRLLVLRDAESGWTDLGSPRRVVDVVTRHGLRPQWLSSDYRPTALASSF